MAWWVGAARHGRIQSQLANAQNVRATLAKLPLAFEPNVGQTDGQVKYVARGNGYTVFLTEQEAVLSLKKHGTTDESVVGLKFSNNASPKTEAMEREPGISNYYNSRTGSRHEKVPNYGAVRYSNVDPGVDIVFRGNEGSLRYDYVVKPGADPATVHVALTGVRDIKLGANGDLVLNGGELTQPKPFIYQEVRGKKNRVDGGYVLLADNQVGFHVDSYDRSRDLVIDPTLVFGDYVGGTGVDEVLGVAQDPNGLYFVGDTNSVVFPSGDPGTKPGAATVDAFIMSTNRAGTVINYRTFYGGTGADFARGLAFGHKATAPGLANDVLYVVGDETSTSGGSIGAVLNGGAATVLGCTAAASGQQAFVLVVDNNIGGGTGGTISSTAGTCQYVGANGGTTFGRAITSDDGLNIWVGGSTTGLGVNLVGTHVTQEIYQGGSTDGYVSQLVVTPAGSIAATTVAFGAQTYVGGANSESVNKLLYQGAAPSHVIVVGTTNSDSTNGFPTVAGSYQTVKGSGGGSGNNAFVLSLLSTLIGAPQFGTFFGGTGGETGTSVAVDTTGNIYLTGQTASQSSTFPSGGTFRNALAGTANAYVAKFNPAGTALLWATYVGGSGSDAGNDIAVDVLNQAYLVGTTTSPNFPIAFSPNTGSNPLQSAVGGTSAAFVTRLNPTGTAVNYSGVDGQTGTNTANALALDQVTAPNTLFFGGATNGGLVTQGAGITAGNGYQGGQDGFVSALLFNDVVMTPSVLNFTVTNGVPAAGTLGSVFTYTNTVQNATFGPVVYSCGAGNPGTFTGSCSTAWLQTPTFTAPNLSVSLAAAANTLQAGNYVATFTVTGNFDNSNTAASPLVFTVNLRVNQTITTPANVSRTFQKSATPLNVGGTNTGTANLDSFVIPVATTPSLAYKVSVAFDSGNATCNNQGSWISAVTPTSASQTAITAPATGGTAFTITYSPAVLEAMDLTNVEGSPAAPKCTAHVTFSTPNNNSADATFTTTVVPIVMNFTSRLIPTIPAISANPYPLSTDPTATVPLVFNFTSPLSAAAAQIVTVQGDGLAIHFSTPVAPTVPVAGPGASCTVGVTTSPVSPGPPYLAPDNNVGINPTGTISSFSITVNPLGCPNNIQLASFQTVTLTATGAEASVNTVIPITINIGNVMTSATTGSNVFTGPNATSSVADTPTGYSQPGFSIATDLSQPTSAYRATIGDQDPLGSYNYSLNVSTLAATGAGCTRAASGPTGAVVATANTPVESDWFIVTPDASQVTGSTPAHLTFSVDPAVWPGMQSTVNGCVYQGTVTVNPSPLASASGGPLVYNVSFTKINQPVVTSNFTPALTTVANSNLTPGTILLQGVVGQGLVAPDTFTVTTPGIFSAFTADESTAALVNTSYPGYNYPNRGCAAGGVSKADTDGAGFVGGACGLSWLTASVGGGTVTVNGNTVNLTPSPTQPVPGSGTCPAGTLLLANASPQVCASPYTGVVRLRSGTSAATSGSGENVVEIPVAFVVTQAPAVTLTPSGTQAFAFTLLSTAPAAPSALTKVVTASSTSATTAIPYTLTVTAATLGANACAITAANVTGIANAAGDPITITVPASCLNGSLPAGTYLGNVQVNAPTAAVQVQNIPVSLALSAAPTISSTPPTASYAMSAGGPAPSNTQNLTISYSGSSTFTAAYAAGTGGNWLTVVANGNTSGSTVTISLNSAVATTLAANATPYTGNVQITDVNTGNSVFSIPVSLTVNPFTLSSVPTQASFTALTGTAPSSTPTTFTINYPGTTTFTAAFVPTSGGNWLTLTTNGNSPASVVSATLNAAVLGNPVTLASGTYTGTIQITDASAANTPLNIGVSLIVNPANVISVAPSTTATFNDAINGTTPTAQVLAVSVSNGAIPLTLTGTIPAWLNAALSSVAPATTNSGTLTLSINQASVNGMPNGLYTASLVIGSTQAGVASVNITVNLNISGQPVISANGGATAPLSVAYTLGNSTASTPLCSAFSITGSTLGNVTNGLVITPTTTYTNGGTSWIPAVSLTGGTTPTTATVCATPSQLATLAVGTYTGTVTFASPNAISAVVNVTLTIYPQPVLSGTGVSYSAVWGNTTPPAALTPTAITIASTPTTVASNLSLATSGSCAWANISLSATTTPATLVTSVNAAGYANLTPGTVVGGPATYTCTATVNGTAGNPSAPAVFASIPVSITINPLTMLANAVSGGGGTLFLQIPNGALFGYFGYLTGNWLYHVDLGYEYVVPGNDAANGIYMFDSKSGHWWYTAPGAFPYVYDFTIKAWLYYFPNQNVSGHYTTNPRYFANMTTSVIFTM